MFHHVIYLQDGSILQSGSAPYLKREQGENILCSWVLSYDPFQWKEHVALNEVLMREAWKLAAQRIIPAWEVPCRFPRNSSIWDDEL